MKRFLIAGAFALFTIPAMANGTGSSGDAADGGMGSTGTNEAYTVPTAVIGVENERDRLQTYRLGAARSLEQSGLHPAPLVGRDALMAARR